MPISVPKYSPSPLASNQLNSDCPKQAIYIVHAVTYTNQCWKGTNIGIKLLPGYTGHIWYTLFAHAQIISVTYILRFTQRDVCGSSSKRGSACTCVVLGGFVKSLSPSCRSQTHFNCSLQLRAKLTVHACQHSGNLPGHTACTSQSWRA